MTFNTYSIHSVRALEETFILYVFNGIIVLVNILNFELICDKTIKDYVTITSICS